MTHHSKVMGEVVDLCLMCQQDRRMVLHESWTRARRWGVWPSRQGLHRTEVCVACRYSQRTGASGVSR